MVNGVSQNYSSWIQSLHSRGIHTTSLGANEANFADYTSALSESLKQEIAASFDSQADYDLQARLAALFGGRSVMQSGDIIQAARSAGINVSVRYVPTTYIVDNKKGGSYMNNKTATSGSIAVYTFSDGKGGEIKIADANGNGALEAEEIFMNELLSGVTSDISAAGGAGATGGAGAGAVDTNAEQQAYLAQLEAQMEEDMQRLDDLMKQADKDQKKYEVKAQIEKNYPDIKGDKLDESIETVLNMVEESNMPINTAIVAVLGEPKAEGAKSSEGSEDYSLYGISHDSKYQVEDVSFAGVTYINTEEEEPEETEETGAADEAEEPEETDGTEKSEVTVAASATTTTGDAKAIDLTADVEETEEVEDAEDAEDAEDVTEDVTEEVEEEVEEEIEEEEEKDDEDEDNGDE